MFIPVLADSKKRIIDTFTGSAGPLSSHVPDSGNFGLAWKNAPSIWTIDGSGNAIATPTEGTDQAPGSTCTSVGSEVDATTGWNNQGMSVFASDTEGTEPSGSHSLHITANSAADYITLATPVTVVVGTTYKIRIRYKVANGDATTQLRLRAGSTAAVTEYFQENVNDATWATFTRYFIATTTELYLRIYETADLDNVDAYIDTFEVIPLTTSELLNLTNTEFSQGYIKSTGNTIAAGAIDGVAGLWDASKQNGIVAYVNRTTGTGVLRSMIAGVWQSALIDTAVTYSAGANIHLLFDGQYVYFWYNNLLVGTRQDISPLSTIIYNTYWGLMSTDAASTISGITIRPLQFGNELFDTDAGAFTSGTYSWVKEGNNTIANDAGQLKITYVDNANGAYVYLKDASDLTSDLTVGEIYKLTLDGRVNLGSVEVTVVLAGVKGGTVTFTETGITNKNFYFVAQHATNMLIYMYGSMGAGEIIWLDNLKLMQVQ